MLSLEQRGLMAIVSLLCGPFVKAMELLLLVLQCTRNWRRLPLRTMYIHVVGTSARAAAATYRCLARTSVRSWAISYWV